MLPLLHETSCFEVMLNRRMPNGTYWWCERGERISPTRFDGAWESIVGNCDTFIYLGGNEASTYEYVSKLLGKWTIDKRTSGMSKGSSGSYSENYDVLGRELMLEYEIRLLPDDECIIFVRGENPIRDKKRFPWEHEEYLEARKCGKRFVTGRIR